jgi:hypothetical protein
MVPGPADAVGRNLQQILEQGDTPAGERGDQPRLVAHVLQMRIPGKSHEDAGKRKQNQGLQRSGHGRLQNIRAPL